MSQIIFVYVLDGQPLSLGSSLHWAEYCSGLGFDVRGWNF